MITQLVSTEHSWRWVAEFPWQMTCTQCHLCWGSSETFPGGSACKEAACNAGDLGLIPGLGRSPGGGKGDPLQYPGRENSLDCVVHRVVKSQTRLTTFTSLHVTLLGKNLCTCLLWTSPHTAFALYPFATINHSCEDNYMLSPPGKSRRPGMVLGTPSIGWHQTGFFSLGRNGCTCLYGRVAVLST